MPIKSTQTNKYEYACFVQEAPTPCEVDPRGFKQMRSVNGNAYVEFDSTLQTFNCYNRMRRRYDPMNLCSVIDNDERITTLKRQNKWRGNKHPRARTDRHFRQRHNWRVERYDCQKSEGNAS